MSKGAAIGKSVGAFAPPTGAFGKGVGAEAPPTDSRNHFIVGMENSAPARIPVGHRAVIVFIRV